MASPTQQFGTSIERAAEHYLQQQGLQLIGRNYRCRYGEIDLIMSEQNNLVFVEVRCRQNQNHGSGIESITSSKKSKIIKSANCFLIDQNLWEKVSCRFDVVSILPAENEITWVKDAFWAKW